jgi:toxin CcdB
VAELVIEQFSVRRLRGRSRDQHVLVLQSHLLEGVDTVLVAPLLSAPKPESAGLAVTLSVGGREFHAALNQMAAIPAQVIGAEVARADALEDEIRRGLDRLFTGF